MWEDEIFSLLDEIKDSIDDAKVILGGKAGGKVTLPLEGKINISAIRATVQKCLSLSSKSLEKPEEGTFWAMLRCDLALGQRGPDGNPILMCHPNDFFCCSNKPWDEVVKEFPEAITIVPKKEVIPTPLPEVTITPPLKCENCPYFSQADERWNPPNFYIIGPGCTTTMRRNGCALTSLAMILSGFGVEKANPLTVGKLTNQLGLWICGEGSPKGFACKIADTLAPGQFECKYTESFNEVLKALEAGKMVLFGANGHPPYVGDGKSHYYALTKIENAYGEKIIYYNNPGRKYPGERKCSKLPASYFQKAMLKAYIIGRK
jgi:hypothetical protein